MSVPSGAGADGPEATVPPASVFFYQRPSAVALARAPHGAQLCVRGHSAPHAGRATPWLQEELQE